MQAWAEVKCREGRIKRLWCCLLVPDVCQKLHGESRGHRAVLFCGTGPAAVLEALAGAVQGNKIRQILSSFLG